MARALPFLLLLGLFAGCAASEPSGIDAGEAADATGADTGLTIDSGTVQDAKVLPDAEPVDSGAPVDAAADAGLEDGGPAPDSGQDAGPPDMDAGSVPDAGPMAAPDPAQVGPFTSTAYAETLVVPASGNDLPMDCEYPTAGPAAGPFPAVLIGHGFQLPAAQYRGYAQRLASFGYVACTADFRATIIAHHAENALDIVGGVDWLLAVNAQTGHPLFGKVAPTQIGLMGHSLGGKVAFLAAAQDARVAAVFGLDPVDSSSFCSAARCPDATDMLPFTIPVGVLGETIDSSGSLQNCAPAADNFQTFYEAASSPAYEADVLGANHMSFIDDPSTCGLPCSACQAATAPHNEVIELARAMTVAFFERYLRQDTRYDSYLSGVMAQQRYVQPGRAVIRTK